MVCVKAELSKYKALKQREPLRLACSAKEQATEKKIIILVIGESLNRNHMQLYGYNKPTNPLLTKRTDLIIYPDVVSKYTNTLSNVVAMYTQEDTTSAAKASITLTDVFNSAGYTTYWMSNQSPIGIWDNAISNIEQISKYKFFVNQTGNSSQETLFSKSYDELLLPVFQKYVGKEEKQFFVLHLLGNHTKYAYRYPEAYDFFKNASSSKQATINEYDNAVR